MHKYCSHEDLICSDVNNIFQSLEKEGIYSYNSGDIIKRIIRDENSVRIYVLDYSNGGIAIIKNTYENYSVITLSEDDGYFYPGNLLIEDKISLVYLLSEAVSLLNNISE